MKELLLGATIGDICGSIYEWENRKTDTPSEIQLVNKACRFTDDTVLTAAIAEAVRTGEDYGKALHRWANKYRNVGFAPSFRAWMKSTDPKPYNSWGNGAAMRVSAIGWLKTDDKEVILEEAKRSALPTHNHPEGIKGAQATALAIWLARRAGGNMDLIRASIQDEFGYDLSRRLADIRSVYDFDVSCQGTVPVAIIAFLESHDFTSAIQNAISVGGDSDTIAAITGSIAEAYYSEIPEELVKFAIKKMDRSIAIALGVPEVYNRDGDRHGITQESVALFIDRVTINTFSWHKLCPFCQKVEILGK